MNLFLMLLIAHVIADYALQGPFLAMAKNRTEEVVGVPWYEAMLVHCLTHGAFVALLTGSIWLGLAELALHFLIDDAKCRGKLSFAEDQNLHLLCKLLWVALAVDPNLGPFA
jgi:hypothetical protein